MKKQSLPIKVKQLKKMYENRTLHFDNPIQRRSDQWGVYRSSILINSILNDVIIPPIYLIKEDMGSVDAKGRKISDYSVIDGQQRLTETFAFIDGKYKLHKLTPPVDVDGENIEIAGKYFFELDEDLQQDIENFVFTTYNLEGNSDEDIEEFFLRINGGIALSKNQNTKARVGVKMMRYFKPFLEKHFFHDACNFSGAQYRTEVDFCTMLQCIMLIDASENDFNLTSLSESDTNSYGARIHDGLEENVKEQFEKVMSYLGNAFSDFEKLSWLRKTHIPIVFMTAKHAMEQNISTKDFAKWYIEFSENYYSPDCEYAQYCGAGSVKKQKVLGRIEVMQRHFDEYFNIGNGETEENECE